MYPHLNTVVRVDQTPSLKTMAIGAAPTFSTVLGRPARGYPCAALAVHGALEVGLSMRNRRRAVAAEVVG